jgi:hypothetical protein
MDATWKGHKLGLPIDTVLLGSRRATEPAETRQQYRSGTEKMINENAVVVTKQIMFPKHQVTNVSMPPHRLGPIASGHHAGFSTWVSVTISHAQQNNPSTNQSFEKG